MLFSILILFYIPLPNAITEALYKFNEDKESILLASLMGKAASPHLAIKNILNTVNMANWQVLSRYIFRTSSKIDEY